MAVRVIGSWYWARWAGSGSEKLLKNLFAAELPEELFRKVITFWAPVWR